MCAWNSEVQQIFSVYTQVFQIAERKTHVLSNFEIGWGTVYFESNSISSKCDCKMSKWYSLQNRDVTLLFLFPISGKFF